MEDRGEGGMDGFPFGLEASSSEASNSSIPMVLAISTHASGKQKVFVNQLQSSLNFLLNKSVDTA